MMRVIIALVMTLSLVMGAVEEDLVKDVPGYQNFTTSVYSGYLDTGDSNRKLHYVFVESAKGKNNNDPVTLWLNGGPGCSSMLGFLQEIGPFYLEDGADYEKGDKLTLNPYSWHTASNLLFIESPAGVGFSYNLASNYTHNDTTTATDTLSALLYFYKGYSEYLPNALWLAGESYAGKYIPDLAVLIDRTEAINHLNLKGILVGNGVMDFRDGELEKSSVDFMMGHEFVDPELINVWKTSCLFDYDSAGCNYFIARYEIDLDDLNPYNVYDYCFYNSTKLPETQAPRRSEASILRSISGFLKANPGAQEVKLDDTTHKYGSAPCVYLDGVHQYFNAHRVEYHAKFPNQEFNGPCADNLTYVSDLAGSMKSYEYLIGKLTKYHIFLYNGDWDQVVPYTDTLKNLKKLRLEESHAYSPWFTNGQHSGFMEIWSGVHFITFKGASHMVPQSKRADALNFFKMIMGGSPHKLLIR